MFSYVLSPLIFSFSDIFFPIEEISSIWIISTDMKGP